MQTHSLWDLPHSLKKGGFRASLLFNWRHKPLHFCANIIPCLLCVLEENLTKRHLPHWCENISASIQIWCTFCTTFLSHTLMFFFLIYSTYTVHNSCFIFLSPFIPSFTLNISLFLTTVSHLNFTVCQTDPEENKVWSLPMSLRWSHLEAKSVLYYHSYCFIDFFRFPSLF